MFGEDPNVGKQKESQEQVKTLISLASLLVAAIGIAAKDLPWWALVLLATVICILLGFIVWSPFVSLYGALCAWRKRKKVAIAFYADLDYMFQRLLRELSDNHTDNLHYQLRDLVATKDKKGNNVIASIATDFSRIGEWLRIFQTKLLKRHPRDFPEIARAMNIACTQYWWMSYGIWNHLQQIVQEQLLDEPELKKVKQAWNHGRDSANRFLVEWEALCEKINREFPEHVGSAHHSALKNIE